MSTLTKRSLLFLTAGSFFAFFVFGFADNLKGATLPPLLEELHLSYSQGGTIGMGAFVGYILATLLMGTLADAAGKKAVILVAGVCLLVGMAGYSVSGALWPLTATMAIIGLGLGSLEVGGNTMIVDLHSQDKGRHLNLLNVFYGVGSMIAPLYAGQLLASHLSWRLVYRLSLALVVLLPLYFLSVSYPHRKPVKAEATGRKGLRQAILNARMAWFFVLFAVYVAAEVGTAFWVVEFLQKAKGQSIVLSSAFLSLFFGGITAGRFLGSFVVERIGYLRVMLLAAIAASICVAAGVFGPPALAFFLPLTGLFFSIMFPTATAAVSDLQSEHTGAVLGLLFTFGGLGGMLGPWLVGLCSDWLGIGLGFGAVLAYCLVMIIALVALLAIKPSRAATDTR